MPSQRGTKSLSQTFSWTVLFLKVFSHFQKTSKDTSFSPAPDQLILTLTYSIKKIIIIIPSYVYCARLTETCHGTCILLLSRWSDCFYCSPHLYVSLEKAGVLLCFTRFITDSRQFVHLTALATSGSSHHVQDTDACIQNDHRLSTTSTHYYESTSPPEV